MHSHAQDPCTPKTKLAVENSSLAKKWIRLFLKAWIEVMSFPTAYCERESDVRIKNYLHLKVQCFTKKRENPGVGEKLHGENTNLAQEPHLGCGSVQTL